MADETVKIKRFLVRNIKKYRAGLGFTQEEAAERANITVKYWQRLEMVSQKDLPSLQMLSKMSKALEIPMWKLLCEHSTDTE